MILSDEKHVGVYRAFSVVINNSGVEAHKVSGKLVRGKSEKLPEITNKPVLKVLGESFYLEQPKVFRAISKWETSSSEKPSTPEPESLPSETNG